MRKIEAHHDGHGLNDSITITADDRDPDSGGASHEYELFHTHKDMEKSIGRIQFQHGPRNAEGSTVGVTEAALYAVLIDRLKGFQRGPFACKENAMQLTKLEECLMWARARADDRAARGVLGKNAE